MSRVGSLAVVLLVLASAVAAPEEAPAETATPWASARALRRRKAKRALQRVHSVGEGTGARRVRTEEAIAAALGWLVRHQSGNGSWQAREHARWRDGQLVPEAAPATRGQEIYDVGITGLALTALIVAGYGGEGEHPFDRAVRKGLAHLCSVQDEEGCFGPRVRSPTPQLVDQPYTIVAPPTRSGRSVPDTVHQGTSETDRAVFTYNHAAAALAMVEAYGTTGSETYRSSAEKALAFIERARNPYFAWRYGVRPGDNDTSVTAWMVLVLGTARQINRLAPEGAPPPLPFEEAALQGAIAFCDKIIDPDSGRAGYVTRSIPYSTRDMEVWRRGGTDRLTGTSAMAATVLVLAHPGSKPLRKPDERLEEMIACFTRHPPAWDPARALGVDLIRWHFASLALHHFGGTPWRKWSSACDRVLIENQEADASWAPSGVWGHTGGRVYATALNALTLQTHYRLPDKGRF